MLHMQVKNDKGKRGSITRVVVEPRMPEPARQDGSRNSRASLPAFRFFKVLSNTTVSA